MQGCFLFSQQPGAQAMEVLLSMFLICEVDVLLEQGPGLGSQQEHWLAQVVKRITLFLKLSLRHILTQIVRVEVLELNLQVTLTQNTQTLERLVLEGMEWRRHPTPNVGGNTLTYQNTGTEDASHTHTISVTVTNNSTGSGTAHNTMQPYKVVTKIIKF
jgi:hypothetical protein